MRLFGTDGIRMRGKELTSGTLPYRIGLAVARYFKEKCEGGKVRVLIGRDTRATGTAIERELARGIAAGGGEAHSLGIAPTPAIGYLTEMHGYTCGISVSASHNGAEYNGIKIIGADSKKLPDADEDMIDAIAATASAPSDECDIDISDVSHLAEDYKAHVISTARAPLRLKVALDAANGAAYLLAPQIFDSLGCECVTVGCSPNGENINYKCGATDTDALCRTVIENGCDVGFAFDGDADRCIAVNERGEVVDGDGEIAVIAEYLKKSAGICGEVVGTVMTNGGLAEALLPLGLTLSRTAVGDKYVSDRMCLVGAALGGESSGHIIISHLSRTGDGLVTAALLAHILCESECKFSYLCRNMKYFPQFSLDILADKEKKARFSSDERIGMAIAEAKRAIGGGRLITRPSGTEEKIRIMAESASGALAGEVARTLAMRIE